MSDEGTIKSGREKKPLSLKRQERPEVNQSADAGQVRQSFSHGRSRSVAVEVRKKRNITQAGGVSATPTKARAARTLKEVEPAVSKTAEAPPTTTESGRDTPKSRVVLRTLTNEEKATRARAVESAVKEEGRKRHQAEIEAALRAEEDQTRAVEHEEAERRAAEEEARRTAEEEKRRQAEEEAARRLAVPEEATTE